MIKTNNITKSLLIDKQKKNTLVCIHGYNSSKAFIGNLGEKKTNFNILSFSLSGAKDDKKSEYVTIKELALEIKRQIHKLKHTKIYLLAHSFGGVLINELLKHFNFKIKGIIYLSTFHPLIMNFKLMKLLKSIINPQTQKDKIAASLLRAGTKLYQKTSSKNFDHFLDQKNPWMKMLIEMTEDESLTELNKRYEKNKNKSIYIVGDEDKIISTTLFKEYVENNLEKTINIVKAEHSPLLENINETLNVINNFIPDQKRSFMWRNIYKL